MKCVIFGFSWKGMHKSSLVNWDAKAKATFNFGEAPLGCECILCIFSQGMFSQHESTRSGVNSRIFLGLGVTFIGLLPALVLTVLNALIGCRLLLLNQSTSSAV